MICSACSPFGCSDRCGVGLASDLVVVDCWIGIVQETDRRVVRLAGRLSVAQVPELLTACAEGGPPLEVDLTDLVSADPAGIEALQRIQRAGGRLVGAPGYLQLKLDTSAEGPASPLPRKNTRQT